MTKDSVDSAAPTRPGAVASPGAHAKSAPIRTLLVDDNALFRDDLHTFVAELPRIEVIGEAHDGLQAVHRASILQPDLVLMDYGLPHINGLVAARRIRQVQSAVRIIIITAFDTTGLNKACLTGGADGYVSKYSVREELPQLIAGLCFQGLEKQAVQASKVWKTEPNAFPSLGTFTGKVGCHECE